MKPVENKSKTAAEQTDLERRVLAHERILQALIAYMARTEPRFINHLKERFVEPMNMVQHEHDHRETDDYAEAFIREIMLLDEPSATRPNEPKVTGEAFGPAQGAEVSSGPTEDPSAQPDRVRVIERNGIWEVRDDDTFRGDFHQKEHALAAAALLRLPK
ncbi:hypothetical protein M8756_00540 [Lutimaribacter sp. EGI FJ00015]|uniref:Uncharacterized protein n=1 Tax=Lutimaribacter degradans TaxID=2945989 RepID=A0ACC5ZT05_9RHOB|nr:hypothetical protein [Lutimaribacter sp. EGI FJ00013]MCM2561270.1 hypothetical protein [Lutimaribacter sp. EGI FJ00013]MCO0611779.1 hypothetical protein [Lutimaribacter sp. EGI FJ00015]MCO0635099.1 hypothetical protein [Lutimaribacter sp. EGI FJ00014]